MKTPHSLNSVDNSVTLTTLALPLRPRALSLGRAVGKIGGTANSGLRSGEQQITEDPSVPIPLEGGDAPGEL